MAFGGLKEGLLLKEHHVLFIGNMQKGASEKDENTEKTRIPTVDTKHTAGPYLL